MGKWISVKKELPKYSGLYLVINTKGFPYTALYRKTSKKFDGEKVTHWREIPEFENEPKTNMAYIQAMDQDKLSLFIMDIMNDNLNGLFCKNEEEKSCIELIKDWLNADVHGPRGLDSFDEWG